MLYKKRGSGVVFLNVLLTTYICDVLAAKGQPKTASAVKHFAETEEEVTVLF